MFFASSLTAINVAYGSGVCSSSSLVIFFLSSLSGESKLEESTSLRYEVRSRFLRFFSRQKSLGFHF